MNGLTYTDCLANTCAMEPWRPSDSVTRGVSFPLGENRVSGCRRRDVSLGLLRPFRAAENTMADRCAEFRSKERLSRSPRQHCARLGVSRSTCFDRSGPISARFEYVRIRIG